MASTYSTSLRIQLIGTGDQSGTWGTTTNNNLGTLIEQAITGYQVISVAGLSAYTLTSFNGIPDEARNAVLEFTGALSGNCTVTAPAVPKNYFIKNSTTGGHNIIITTGSGSTAVIPPAQVFNVYSDGTNYYVATNYDATNVNITGGAINNTSIGATTASTGRFTTLQTSGALTYGGVTLSNSVTGTGSMVLSSAPILTLPLLSAETYSTNSSVSAAGTTQGTATALVSDYNIITTVGASAGVVLPIATIGRRIIVVNKGANTLNIYPASGGSIDALSANAAITLPVNGWMEFNASSITQWYSTFNVTNATSFSAGTTGLTPSTATTGTITLGGTLNVANGGTGNSSYTTGDIIYASASGTLSKLADVATGNALISGGVGVAPSYGKIGLTTHVSGTLPVANGGTGVTTSTGSGNNVLSTSPTLVTPILGTPTSGTLTSCTGLPLTTGVTGTLPATNGGTGQSTYAVGDLLQGGATNTLTKLAAVATGNALISGGVTTASSWGKIGLTTHVSGTLPVASGGTGAATLTANNVLLGNGTSALQTVAPGTSGNVLTSNGTTWISSAAFVTGMIMMWSGTIATIPTGWRLCDGTNSTPDLRNRFIVGAFADSAGVASTTITGSNTQTGGTKDAIVVSHTHTATVTDPGHNHTPQTLGSAQAGADNGGAPVDASTGYGTGRVSSVTSTSTTGITVANSTEGSSGTNQNLPPYYALAFIMKS